jgi:hypothetical protein
MIDYSDSLIKIQILRKKAHNAILSRRWEEACGYTDQIITAAFHMKSYCLDQLDKNDQI